MNKNKLINKIMVLTGTICGSAYLMAAAALGHGVGVNNT
jgi:hypothetical protein